MVFKNKNLQNGFTLIELMVVISIISFIASIVAVDVKDARIKGRDTKRILDIGQLNDALQLYYSDNQKYPTCGDPGYPGGCDLINYFQPGTGADTSLDGVFMDFLVPKYISKDPIDPINSLSAGYFYIYTGRAQYPVNTGLWYDYLVGAVLEDPTNPALKGSITAGDPLFGQFYALGMISSNQNGP